MVDVYVARVWVDTRAATSGNRFFNIFSRAYLITRLLFWTVILVPSRKFDLALNAEKSWQPCAEFLNCPCIPRLVFMYV